MYALILALIGSGDPDFTQAPPYRPFAAGIVNDLAAHNTAPNTYFDWHGQSDSAHELTHGANSDLRVSRGGEWFYTLENRAITFQQPKVLITDIAARCHWRGDAWQLYMVRLGRQRNDKPLDLLDEMVAYTHAAMVGHEKCDIDHAREMSYYAWVLVSTVEELDSSYVDLDPLKAFLSWNDGRIDEVCQ
jgi:hypothetical protein